MSKKKMISTTIDIDVWKTFQDLVAKLQPDGDKSASAHLETVLRRENARLTGTEMPKIVDVAALQRQLANVQRRTAELEKSIGAKRLEAFNELAEAYGLDFDNYSNSAAVIRQVLQDSKLEIESETILKKLGHKANLPLFISLIELYTETQKLSDKLLEAQQEQYEK
jgi:hypothetical protein